MYTRHRHQEWLKFLKTIDREVPKDLAIHLICDNYATHKHPDVDTWLDKHPRFHLHFTPTSSSWLNLVDVVRELTDKALRRGVFIRSRPDRLDPGIPRLHNDDPRPYVWTATAESILARSPADASPKKRKGTLGGAVWLNYVHAQHR